MCAPLGAPHGGSASAAHLARLAGRGLSPPGSSAACAVLHHGQLLHMARVCAGEYLPDWEWLVLVMRGVAMVGAASAPLAVKLFCGGALGMLLRMAQRWVAAQPRGQLDLILVAMLRDGLSFALEAFCTAVPQARPAAQAVSCSLLMVVQ